MPWASLADSRSRWRSIRTRRRPSESGGTGAASCAATTTWAGLAARGVESPGAPGEAPGQPADKRHGPSPWTRGHGDRRRRVTWSSSIHSICSPAGGGILADALLGHWPIGAIEIEPFARRVLHARQRDGLLPPFSVWDDVRTFRADNPECSEYIEGLRSIRDRLVVCGGSLVRTSAQRAKARVSPVRAPASGERWRGSFARYDPATSSWRTHQSSLLGASPRTRRRGRNGVRCAMGSAWSVLCGCRTPTRTSVDPCHSRHRTRWSTRG